MNVSMEELMQALVRELNDSYKNINELSREMGYTSPVYLSKKVMRLGLGVRIKGNVLLSPREQETLKNSINRRVKEED